MMELILELSEALVQLIKAAHVGDAEAERVALLRIQRASSDEIARREAESP